MAANGSANEESDREFGRESTEFDPTRNSTRKWKASFGTISRLKPATLSTRATPGSNWRAAWRSSQPGGFRGCGCSPEAANGDGPPRWRRRLWLWSPWWLSPASGRSPETAAANRARWHRAKRRRRRRLPQLPDLLASPAATGAPKAQETPAPLAAARESERDQADSPGREEASAAALQPVATPMAAPTEAPAAEPRATAMPMATAAPQPASTQAPSAVADTPQGRGR